MTKSRDRGSPEVGDTVRVGDTVFEIRAIVAEEDTMLLAEGSSETNGEEIWVLSGAQLDWVREGAWRATEHESLERAE